MDNNSEYLFQTIDDIEQFLEDSAYIHNDYLVQNAIVRYLNKRGKCVMNISTILQIVENG